MRLLILLLFLSAFAMSTPARAQIFSWGDLNLDLRKPIDQQKMLVLSTEIYNPPIPFTATNMGIGWDEVGRAPQEISLEMIQPLAIGLAWRKLRSVSISAKVETLKPLIDWDGVTHLYMRYSPDKNHWSEWQDIRQTNADIKPSTEQTFEGEPAVPAVTRLTYDILLAEHQHMTHTNGDEAGDVHWILGRDPHFFEHCLPFMQYVQFLFEADIEPGQRIQAINIHYSWGVGGLVSSAIGTGAPKAGEGQQGAAISAPHSTEIRP